MALGRSMKKPLTLIACMAAAGAAFLAWAVGPKLLNMKSEYVTADVIRDTRAFVAKTRGQWPRSWQDLGSDDLSSHTHMTFDIDPATATREDILSAIAPRSGRYLTYPHAEDDLAALFVEVRKHRVGTPEQED